MSSNSSETRFSPETGEVPKEIETKIIKVLSREEFKNLLEKNGGVLIKDRRLLRDWRYRLNSESKKGVLNMTLDMPVSEMADGADEKVKLVELLNYLGVTITGESDTNIQVGVKTFPLPVRSVRLRDDDGELEWTVKERVGEKEKKSQGAVARRGETEVRLKDSKFARQLLSQLGYELKFKREKYRTSYRLGNAKVELNEPPRVPSMIEIEAGTEADVLETARILGFKPSEMANMTDTEYLRSCGLSDKEIACLTFAGKQLR